MAAAGAGAMAAAALAVAAWGLTASGCGSPCRDVAVAHAAHRAGAAPGSRRAGEPHARLIVPYVPASALLTEVARAEPPLPVVVPEIAALVPVLGGLSVATRSIRLAPGRPGRVAFFLDLELRAGPAVLYELSARVEVEPVLVPADPATGRPAHVDVGFSGDSVQALGVVPGRGAVDLLVRSLPVVGGHRVSAGLARRTLRLTADRLSGETFQLIRRTLLARLGTITRLRLDLPALPVERTQVRSTRSALVVDMITRLPVRRGLGPDDAGPPQGVAPGHMRLILSGSAAAQSVNWAMDRGLVPARYDQAGSARPDGPYAPRFDWMAGAARPLLMEVFRTAAPCGAIHAAARVDVALRAGQVAVTVSDRQVTGTSGSTLVKVGVWLDTLWSRGLVATQEQAARIAVSLGARSVATTVIRAAVDRDVFAFDIAVSAEPRAR